MNAIIRPSKSIWLTFDQIDFPAKARPTNATDVVALVSSIRTIGLQVPLTVIERDGRYLLIAGRHRLEALRVIGEERVPVRVVDFDDIEARLWTISENLHRTELTALQRSEQIAEFARLTKERQNAARDAQGEQVFYCEKPVQVAQVSGGRGTWGRQPAGGWFRAKLAQNLRDALRVATEPRRASLDSQSKRFVAPRLSPRCQQRPKRPLALSTTRTTSRRFWRLLRNRRRKRR